MSVSINKLLATIDELNTKNKILAAEKDKKLEQVKLLRAEIDRLSISNDEKAKVLAEKEQLIKDLKLQSAELQAFKRFMTVEFDLFKDDAMGTAKALRDEIKQLEQENEALKSENNALKTQE
nr:spindle pole body component 110-like [Ipomoea batatas]